MKVAAVDIGTNTVRLLVRGDGVDLLRRVEVVGLGRGVDGSGRLDLEAMDRAAAMLAEYGRAIGEHRVDRIRAVATSACRDASNAAEFLDRVQPLLGIRPVVIPGDVEAGLSFRGAAAAVPGPDPALVIDPGGGSTEFVFGASAADYAISVDVGSVRLRDRMPGTPPASPEAVGQARRQVARALEAVRLPGLPGRVIGVAGTFTSLAAMHLGLERYEPERVHGAVLTPDDFDRLVAVLAAMPVEQIAAIPAMDPKRAPVMLSGAIIAAEAARVAALPIVVSEADLLDALADDSDPLPGEAVVSVG